jgi:uncharacterized protein (DUF302 family)
VSNPDKDPVVYGTPTAPTFQRSITTRLSYAEVLTRLRKSIEAADVWVLAEVDAQMLLAKDGYRIGSARQILCFHPRYMARLLAADPAALLEAPLKFAVMELPDATIAVRWYDPTVAYARYQNAALTALAEDLARLCQDIQSRPFAECFVFPALCSREASRTSFTAGSGSTTYVSRSEAVRR